MHKTLKILSAILGLALAVPAPDSNAPPKDTDPIVVTSLGQIQGTVIQSRLGKPIYSFRGIRYAKAPVNELRFQPPVPVDKYEGVYNATADAPLCPQPTSDPTSEDCLFLNVYSTKLPKENDKTVKRPVIVYIHAGGFYSVGSASYWEGPQYFMDQDIVLVTFNYRLGTLGFLATGEKEAPGNNGLKDQVQVLKWINKNIEGFGGDPNSVTLMGYSAGGVSVVLHMVSPLSAGLFHKAIAMSGSPTSQWTIAHEQLDLAKRQAKFVGCPDDTAANVYKCLKTARVNDLGQSLPQFAEFGLDPLFIWTPVMEKDFGQPRFLTAHPITLIQNGEFHKVPFITGVTADEFAFKAFGIVNNATLLKDINEKWEDKAPISFLYERKSDHSKAVSAALKKFYLEDKAVDKSSLGKLGELYADASIGFGVNRAVKLISEKNNASTYYYKFSYQGRYSHFYTPDSNNTKPYGVVHHDDLIYLFYISKLFPPFKENSPKEVEMVNKLTILYANFAKYGTPIPTPNDRLDNVKWEPYNIKTQKYLDIGNKLTIQEKLYEKRYAEWEKLFPLEKYAKIK
ncbi:juvenile hormone esterase [Dendroctonus ponderosae]|uniref:Carboxylic ester hydrolase n=3 Tax=Dendroctonus ponderosae TaxID=77166 RepID=J3JWT7_DENPD|nr:juvenile hormone esterase [Dendroctonus ponderosae]AEE62667.1 unknown [Dendroctonus ponderosae]